MSFYKEITFRVTSSEFDFDRLGTFDHWVFAIRIIYLPRYQRYFLKGVVLQRVTFGMVSSWIFIVVTFELNLCYSCYLSIDVSKIFFKRCCFVELYVCLEWSPTD